MAGKPYFFRREDEEDFKQELFFKRPDQNNYHAYVDFLRKHLVSKDFYKKGYTTNPASHWLEESHCDYNYEQTEEYMGNRIDIQRAIDKSFSSGRSRAILHLMWYGFTHKEIATMFGLTHARVTQIVINEIRPKLKGKLKDLFDFKA